MMDVSIIYKDILLITICMYIPTYLYREYNADMAVCLHSAELKELYTCGFCWFHSVWSYKSTNNEGLQPIANCKGTVKKKAC